MNTSAIWSPTLMTGFSEYLGSCMIMVMLFPRIWFISLRFRSSKSRPFKLHAIRRHGRVFPATTGVSSGPVWDFPDPLSPTIPRRSCPRSKLMPRTASSLPVGVSKEILRCPDAQDRLRHLPVPCVRGSRTSRRPSPRRLETKGDDDDRSPRNCSQPPLIQNVFGAPSRSWPPIPAWAAVHPAPRNQVRLRTG